MYRYLQPISNFILNSVDYLITDIILPNQFSEFLGNCLLKLFQRILNFHLSFFLLTYLISLQFYRNILYRYYCYLFFESHHSLLFLFPDLPFLEFISRFNTPLYRQRLIIVHFLFPEYSRFFIFKNHYSLSIFKLSPLFFPFCFYILIFFLFIVIQLLFVPRLILLYIIFSLFFFFFILFFLFLNFLYSLLFFLNSFTLLYFIFVLLQNNHYLHTIIYNLLPVLLYNSSLNHILLFFFFLATFSFSSHNGTL